MCPVDVQFCPDYLFLLNSCNVLIVILLYLFLYRICVQMSLSVVSYLIVIFNYVMFRILDIVCVFNIVS